VVHLQILFFCIEDINNDTYKHIQQEQMSHHDEEHEEEAVHGAHSSAWHLVYFSYILGIKHHANPSLSGHYIEESPECRHDIIEVLVLILPITTEIHASKFIMNSKLIYFMNIIDIAVVESALVEISTQDCKENQEKARHNHHISNVGNGIDQRLNSDSQARIS